MRTSGFNVTVWLLALLLGIAIRAALQPPREQQLEQAFRMAGTGRSVDAQAALRKYLARDPNHKDARLLLGRLAHESRDWATEAALYRDVPDSDPIAGLVRVAEGDAWLKLGRTQAAEDCWRRALRLAPQDPQPCFRLVYLYGVQLRRDPWRRMLWELYDRRLAGVREMIQLMIADHVVWEPEEMIPQLRRFIAADPEDVHSRRALAEYLLNAGRIDQAAAELEFILQFHPADSDAWRLLAICRLARADLAGTREALDRAPAAADDQYVKTEGMLALTEQRFGEAIERLESAVQLAPYDRESHHRLAQAYRFEARAEPAAAHARTADALARAHRICHSLHSQAQANLAEIVELVQLCQSLELVEEARGWVRAGLAIDPSHARLLALKDTVESLPQRSTRPPALEVLP